MYNLVVGPCLSAHVQSATPVILLDGMPASGVENRNGMGREGDREGGGRMKAQNDRLFLCQLTRVWCCCSAMDDGWLGAHQRIPMDSWTAYLISGDHGKLVG